LGPLKYLAEVSNTSMDSVMKWFILLLIIIGDPMAIIMIVIFNKVINGDDDTVNDAVNDAVNEGVINESKLDTDDEYFDKLPIYTNSPDKIVEPTKIEEEPKVEKQVNRTIRVEDLPEKNNRGFSVSIPENKKNNIVERIGSNKEIRDHDIKTVFFKKRR
jgi:hypothetical protein